MFPVNVLKAGYSADLEDAYNYAFENEATTMASIDEANVYGQLTRSNMAKMLSNRWEKVLGLTPDTSKTCEFTDVANVSEELQGYIKTSCELGLMWVWVTKFRPNDKVSRAEFGTVLSRALRGDKNNGATPYYADHLAALEDAGIMTDISNPSMTEVRGYVWIMMKRAEDKGVATPSTCKDPMVAIACALNQTDAACPVECRDEVNNEVKAWNLNVDLASNNPDAMSIPNNAPSLTYAIFDVKAWSEDVTVRSLDVTRMGLWSKADFSKIWIENADWVRVSARQTIGTDDNASLTFSPALVVKSNGTETLSLVAKMWGTTTPPNINYFKLVDMDTSAADINGLPLISNAMTTSNYTVATVTSTVQWSNTTYQIGETNQEFAQWKLANNSSTKDMLLRTLTVKNEWTARIADDTANLGVYINGSKISWTPIYNGESITFPLEDYLLEAGKSQVAYIRGDTVATDQASDTIIFTVRYSEDFNAIEKTSGFGISHDLDTKTSPTLSKTYTIQWGDTTLMKSSTAPASQTKAKWATNVTFLEAKLSVKQDFYADSVKLNIYSNTDNGGVQTNWAAALKNFKLYIDGKIVSTLTMDASDYTDCHADTTLGAWGSKCTLIFDSTVNVAKWNKTIKLIGEIESNAGAYKFRAEIAWIANGGTFTPAAFTNAKYTSNDKAIQPIAGTVTAGDVTIGTSNVTITENSWTPVGQNVVAWTQGLSIAKYTLKANDADDLKITSMKFTLIGGGVDGRDIPSANLYINGVQAWSTKYFSTSNVGSVEFNSINVTIPSNQQVVVELKGNLTNSAAGTLQVDLTSLDVKDSSTTDATANGLVLSTYSLATNTVNSVSLTVGTVGTVTANNNSNSAVSNVLVASNVEQELGKFTFASQYDAIKITNLYLETLDWASLTAQVNDTTPAAVVIGGVYTAIIDGITVSFTATAATVANVTAGLTAAINANTRLADLVTAVDATTKVTITSDIAGKWFTISTSASAGTLTNANTTPNAGSSSIASRISTISLYNAAWEKLADGVMNGNYAYFDMGDSSTFVIPSNANNYIVTVKAKFNPINEYTQTATKIKVALNGSPADAVQWTIIAKWIRAVSQWNNTVLSTASATNVATNLMMLAKSRPTFAYVADDTLVPTNTKLATNATMKAYAFSVTADAAGDVELGSVNVSITAAAAARVTNISIYDKANPSVVLATAWAGTYGAGITTLKFTNSERISATASKTYIVEIAYNLVAATESLSIGVKDSTNDNAFTTNLVWALPIVAASAMTVWSDFSDTAHSSTPAINKDWMNGFKVPGLSSMASRSYTAY